MASTNRSNITSFTITQPFLGAPLQFQPALGSKELEELIDLYVTGSASKQNKLSEITIDFYNNATVDLNTGALTRTYNVLTQWPTLEQSPMSSGYSPVFGTSPSSANLADSAYGSFSMTPPANKGRVTKKPRKETKKEAEIRLPGFSIMTKDGVDVTSSAGRGTKTKEQREHAHLMRIMKACPDCKRKKIRCDPSHRRSHDMSRTSTTKSSSSASSSQPKPSPPSTVPSLTPQTSYASGSTPSFSNAIDDFVLFPEDSWNTDMSLAGLETQDLGQFNFDIIDLNQLPQFNDPTFDFSFDPQLSNFQFDNNFGHTPLMADQYGLDQWASSFGGEDMPVHTRPHSSSPTRNSGGLDSSVQAGWLYDVQDVSPMTESYDNAEGFFPDGSLRQPQLFQNATTTTNSSPLSSASDWSILESSINASPAPQGDPSTPASSQSPEGSLLRTRKRRAVDEDATAATLPLANQRGSEAGIEVDPSDPSDVPVPGAQRSVLSPRSQLSQRQDGSNVQLHASNSGRTPASLESGVRMWVESTHQWQLSTDGSSSSNLDGTAGGRLDSGSAASATASSNVDGRTTYRSASNLERLDASPGTPSSSLLADSLPSGGPLTLCETRQGQLLPEEQSREGLASTASLDSSEEMNIDVQRHRRRIIANANSTPGSDTIGNVDIDLAGTETRATYLESSRSQVRRSENISASSGNLLVLQQAQTNATAATSSSLGTQYMGSPQDASLVLQTRPDASLPGAIPGTTAITRQQTQLSAVIYPLVLPLLATFFASCVASQSGVYMSLSPCLQYLLVPFALSYLLPQSTSTTSSAINFASMILAALSFNNLDFIRQTASVWIGNDPIVAIVKLTLCAVVTAQLPRLFDSALVGCVMMSFFSLLVDGSSTSSSCQGTGLFSSSSASAEDGEFCSDSTRREGTRSWITAMRELTPVVAV